ncbi:hypothetical protein GQ44DRAFT_55837 [Phaeosphaeriaceae sp. PMI808]|nr:hypothetical protein GQ44DRAFT_55837 [Phaeosphaeriaceae sp. PMI808]
MLLSEQHQALDHPLKPPSSSIDRRRHDNALPTEVHYRQLVSRAVTQRLHSPSLDNLRPTSGDSITKWELGERTYAREKAKVHTGALGVTWDRFVEDVRNAEQEVHILAPTRYESYQKTNTQASMTNWRLLNQQPISMISNQEWEDANQAHVNALMIYGQTCRSKRR